MAGLIIAVTAVVIFCAWRLEYCLSCATKAILSKLEEIRKEL